MGGINGAEVLVILVVALLVIGPERLPAYADQLGRWVRSLKVLISSTKEHVAAELGEEGKDVDWASLDPRRYDPRRIVREALLDDVVPGSPGAGRPAADGGTHRPARPASRTARGATAGAAAGAAAAGGRAGVAAAGRTVAGGPGEGAGPGVPTPAGGVEPTRPRAEPSAAAPFDDEAT